MQAKYQVSICIGSKVMANVKVVLKQTNRQTNKQTNKQTDKQTGQKQYAPQILSEGIKPPRSYLGGIKMRFHEIHLYTKYQLSISM